VTGDR